MLSIDNEEVRASQIARLEKIRSTRDEGRAQACLKAITDLASTPSQSGMNSDLSKNFLGLAVDAARARCTVGEITQAMETVWGRHVAVDQMVSGAYKNEYGEAGEIDVVVAKVDEFAANEGRRPRILVAKMGQDGHDRGVLACN